MGLSLAFWTGIALAALAVVLTLLHFVLVAAGENGMELHYLLDGAALAITGALAAFAQDSYSVHKNGKE